MASTPKSAVAEDVCQPNWTLFQGSCYSVGKHDFDFFEAQHRCENQNGMLAEITSKEENDFVKGLLSSEFANDGETKAFFGAYYSYSGNDSTWILDYSWDDLSFNDWANPDWESDIGNEDKCGAMSKDEKWAWVVGDCDDEQKYVCERGTVKRLCFQGACYQILSVAYSFSEIQDKCKEIGGVVLEINSDEEKKFVRDYLKDERIPRSNIDGFRHVWLGATDDASEGEFRWLSTKEKIDYTNWYDGEPNNSGPGGVAENCVYLDGSHKKEYQYAWNDATCDGKCAVVCEIPTTSGITG